MKHALYRRLSNRNGDTQKDLKGNKEPIRRLTAKTLKSLDITDR